MPPTFTFDELIEKAEALGHSPQRTAEYLRQYEAEEMIEVEEEPDHQDGQDALFLADTEQPGRFLCLIHGHSLPGREAGRRRAGMYGPLMR